jgi:hypothetical protein
MSLFNSNSAHYCISKYDTDSNLLKMFLSGNPDVVIDSIDRIKMMRRSKRYQSQVHQ